MDVKWYVNKDSKDKVTAVYRTEWNGSTLVTEQGWSKKSSDWAKTQAVLNWFYNGDTGVSEVTEDEARGLLPKKALK